MRRKVGVMGGTFDPIHVGHLVAASEAMGRLGLEEVIFVPGGNPPHKQGRKVAPAEDRARMVELAVADNPRFSVSRIELERPGLTYTADTLAALKEVLPDTELFFITGADAIAEIFSWYRFDELFDLAQFVAVHRDGLPASLRDLPEGRVHPCPLPALTMSSSEIRRRIQADEPVWYWLPTSVLRHIGERSLYGAKWDYDSSTPLPC